MPFSYGVHIGKYQLTCARVKAYNGYRLETEVPSCVIRWNFVCVGAGIS